METEFPWNFEQQPWTERHDETSINLRSYFDRMPNAKMQEYRPEWTDEHLVDWDGNFRNDGVLFIPCSERDVEVEEYRQVLEESLVYRKQDDRTASIDMSGAR